MRRKTSSEALNQVLERTFTRLHALYSDASSCPSLSATMLDIHTMDKGHCMLKMDGFQVPGVSYFRPDVPIVLMSNSHESR